MSDPSDETLAQQARAGDAAASHALYERYLPVLRRRATRSLGPRVRRRVSESDVLQETWLTAFLRLDGFVDRGPGSFRAWISQILRHKLDDEVRNHVLAQRRSVRREQSQVTDSPGEPPAAHETSPSLHAANKERGQALLAAIDSLPAHYATLLRLVHVHGLTLAEAADRLGRTANSTCKVYGRALERLAEAMKREEAS